MAEATVAAPFFVLLVAGAGRLELDACFGALYLCVCDETLFYLMNLCMM